MLFRERIRVIPGGITGGGLVLDLKSKLLFIIDQQIVGFAACEIRGIAKKKILENAMNFI